jgi:hypothetical protein
LSINYEALAAYAGECLAERIPEPIHIGVGEQIPNLAVAVYVAVGTDGSVLYVGSVCRPSDLRGVNSRLSEHLRRQERFETWDLLYLIPLKPQTPIATVRRIEGRIGAHLGPRGSAALPRIDP